MKAIAALIQSAEELLSAMETCHYCQASLLVEEGPIHCEDCPSGCEHHLPPDCVSIADLHERLRAAVNGAKNL